MTSVAPVCPLCRSVLTRPLATWPELDALVDDYCTRLARTRRARTVTATRYILESFVRWARRTKRRHHLHPSVLSRRLLEAWDLEMVATLAPATRAQSLGVVMRWWRWAYEDEEHGDHVPRPRSVELPAAPRRAVHAPTWKQMDSCIQRIADVRSQRAATLMRFLGWRVGQVVRLRWSDIDLAARTIELRGELGKSRREQEGRTVPLPPHLVVELRRWPRSASGFIVGRTRKRVTEDVHAAWRATKTPSRIFDGRPCHAFRRGFRTELKAAGGDSEAIEFYCGRAILGVGARDYTDPRALHLRKLVRLIPRIAV